MGLGRCSTQVPPTSQSQDFKFGALELPRMSKTKTIIGHSEGLSNYDIMQNLEKKKS
jgi:hypothetical protein